MRLKNTAVDFFGCGNTAKKFYFDYGSELNICRMISNNPAEQTVRFHDKSEYKVERPVQKGKNSNFIIICSNDYENIAEQLMLLGYIPFRDFVDYEMASIVLGEKKILLLYGFCHLRGMKDVLKETASLNKEYEAVFYPNYLFQNAYQQAKLYFLIERCHVLIYGMAVSPENHQKNEALISRLDSSVRKLCLPAVYFGGYFPQKHRAYNALNPYAVKCEHYDYTPFSYGDSWLNACLDKGMDIQDIMDTIDRGPVYKRDFVLRYMEGEWKRLKFQEKESDFRICEYIQTNFRKFRLFRNEAHMENVVIYQYVMQVLHLLGYTESVPEVTEPLMKCSQHFIYPGVANALGLEWDVRKEILELYTYNGWKQVTLEEYIRTYAEVCGSIRKLKMQNLLPG